MLRKKLILLITILVLQTGLMHCAKQANSAETSDRKADEKKISAIVYKSPNCGCCSKWIEHLEKNGFSVRISNEGNEKIRLESGMPKKFGSCHTAIINGYVVEGHVPAQDIHRLLLKKPNAIGLAVPGMPLGSPGMEVPENTIDAYNVLLVDKKGHHSIWSSYPEKGKSK